MNPSILQAPPRASLPSTQTTAGAKRRIAITVDLSDESAYAVRWAVQNYLRPGDAVVLLHVCPTSVLYGADWGSIQLQITPNSKNKHENSAECSDEESQQRLEGEFDFDIFATTRANKLVQPLVDAKVPFKIHIVKDRDMKERLCLEVERLGLSAVIMGSRGFGGTRRSSNGRLGSVSYYCVNHCICPVIVVRYPDEDDSGVGRAERVTKKKIVEEEAELHPVPEEELEHHDEEDEHKG